MKLAAKDSLSSGKRAASPTAEDLPATDTPEAGSRLDIAKLRKRLAEGSGRQYWQSLEDLAGSEEVEKLLQREFPTATGLFATAVSRRGFLRLMGASLALAGLGACTRQPAEKIFSYVKAPEQIVPGEPLFYASGFALGGVLTGILAESHLGRPTKIEGNPQHPASLGATDVLAQASVLGLYDPDRAQVISEAGTIRPWDAFMKAVSDAMKKQRPAKGAGLRLLTGTVTSPTLAAQIRQLLARYPKARWHQYEPACRDSARQGALLAFGEAVETGYDLSRADVILSLDADFLATGRGGLRYAREFAARRLLTEGGTDMNRLYVVEPSLSNTGAKADHRLAVVGADVARVATRIAADLGLRLDHEGRIRGHDGWIRAVARDLARHRGRGLIMAGETQPAAVHALAHLMNAKLGNAGSTVFYTEPIEAEPSMQCESLRELVDAMAEGAVDTLIILGGNPVYNAPVDLDFAGALGKVATSVHLSLYDDETSNLCRWHVSEAHALESWTDGRACDGTITIVQPLINPLYGGKTAHEIVALLLGDRRSSSHDLVRKYWHKRHATDDFEAFWKKSLHDGVVAGSAVPVKEVKLREDLTAGIAESLERSNAETGEGDAGLELLFRLDPHVHDGSFTNNAWLQELPKPITRLTWENAVLMGPALAERLGLASNDVVELRYRNRLLTAPVWVTPGQAEGSVLVHLGYGRSRAGHVGNGIGFNAYALRTLDAPWQGTGLRVGKTGRCHQLVTTQKHNSMEGREPVRAASLAEYRHDPSFASHGEREEQGRASLYPGFAYKDHAWGMTIDLQACIGCNACTIACQAENNIAVVGKDQVSRGREMHWIRVDRYFEGGLDNPLVYHQPVPCMQCEDAPCELVCPVNATVHSKEGLNDMVYNRCVGTRYCANNCPYKVRRFNFYLYSDWNTESLKMQRNPDVTVRSRGVMEKCTYCVQRISQARIVARREGRTIRDGEIIPACQAVCPTEAIVFGDINDSDSRVSKHKKEPRNYALLDELGTRPRTTYLATVRNPNPQLPEERSKS